MELFEAAWRRVGLRPLERRPPVPREGRRCAAPLLGVDQERGGRAGVVRAGFAFRLGPHLLRGRVDRVDRLPDGSYELIDYKTGKPEDGRRAARGHAALALPDGRARGLGSRDLRAELLLRARGREGAGGALRGAARARARHGGRDRRRDHGPGVRADGRARRSARSATTGSSARRRRSSARYSSCRRCWRKRWKSRAIVSADGIRSGGSSDCTSSSVCSSRSTKLFTSGSLATAAFTWRS